MWHYLFKGKKKEAKFFLSIGVVINLGLLSYFKYAMLFISPEMITALNTVLPQSLNLKGTFNIALPLGISFLYFSGNELLD
jgi:D-alanyl-lipoteichoic acid acyltransferase DltB (MBOAT superfamily)